jgi:flagella basal body P-ring formation protein FlgA
MQELKPNNRRSHLSDNRRFCEGFNSTRLALRRNKRIHRANPAGLYTSCFCAVSLLLLFSMSAGANQYQPHNDIQKSVKAFLQQQLEQSNAADFKIHINALDQRLKLTACDAPLETSLAPGAKLLGKTTVAVQCSGPKPWKIFVPASLVLYEKVLATSRTIVRGQSLGAGDLTMVNQRVNSASRSYFSNVEQAVGFVAKRSIAAGKVLTAQMLQAPRLVRRGQEVILLATTPLLEVRMKGQALSDGAKGDVIQVRNVTSKRVVEGVVSGAGVVKVSM